MEKSPIPTNGVLVRTAEIDVANSRETVFKYISGGEALPAWLKKCGPVNGVVKTVVNKGPYTTVGASRTVYFDDGSTIVEQLTEFDPFSYYAYSVTDITNALRHLTNLGYGQWWFEERAAVTHVKWTYSFVPKNVVARLFLSVFLSLFYKKFMNQALQLAKGQLERQAV